MNRKKLNIETMLKEQAEGARVRMGDAGRERIERAVREAAGRGVMDGREGRGGAWWKMAAGLGVAAGLAAWASLMSTGERLQNGASEKGAWVFDGARAREAISAIAVVRLDRWTGQEVVQERIVKPIDHQTVLLKRQMERAWEEFQHDLPRLPRLMHGRGGGAAATDA